MSDDSPAFKGRHLLPAGAVCLVLGIILSSTLILLPLGVPLGLAGVVMMLIGLVSFVSGR